MWRIRTTQEPLVTSDPCPYKLEPKVIWQGKEARMINVEHPTYKEQVEIMQFVKVIYVAGPFRATTQWRIMQNVKRAEDVSLKLWKLGYAVICPHTMTQHFQDECPDEVWLKGCLELMTRADAIYLLKGWENSEGSIAELKIAREIGLAVLGDSDTKIPQEVNSYV